MSKDYKVVSANDVTPAKRTSPMHLILQSVEGDFWTAQQVADHIGVHVETIRRVTKRKNTDGSKLVQAPTSAVRSGQVVMYLFTKDDVVELENHFDAHGYVVPNRIDKKKTLASQAVSK